MTAPAAAEVFAVRDRVAVVTGASSGIGARIASLLAANGAQVVAAARRLDRLEALAADDGRIHPVACDVSRPEDRAHLMEVAAGIGPVDVLVNNAALAGSTSTDDEEPADVAAVLDVNVVAAYDLARRLRSQHPAGARASVLNVSSVLGLVSGAPLAGAGYAASKAALLGLTRELAGQWGRVGIRVNALAPGWIHTEMTADLFADERSARWVERQTMLGRGGDVAELDGIVLFLASDASSYCTGQTYVVDGGWTAR